MNRRQIKKRIIIWALLFISLTSLGNITYSEEKKDKLSFSIILTGGQRYTSIGDMNKHLENFDNHLSELTSYEGSKIKKLNNDKKTLEGEIRLDVSSKFAIGFGIEGISDKNESRFEFKDPWPWIAGIDGLESYPHTISTQPEVSAVNFKLGTYYTIPLVRRIYLFLDGGIDYYISKAHLHKYHKILGPISIYDSLILKEEDYDVTANGLGFHGGIGFEYKILDDLSLVLGFQGRYARIKNLKGTEMITERIGIDPEEREGEGVLHIGEKMWLGEYFPDLIIFESQPSGGEFRNVREAVLDFSGYSLRLGLKINFFRRRR